MIFSLTRHIYVALIERSFLRVGGGDERGGFQADLKRRLS
jgi:hypothetical protein